MVALLSIKPQYVRAIVSGEKMYEFRRRGFARTVDTILVYATAPVMRLVLALEVGTIIRKSPPRVWQQCRVASGLSKDQFDRYFAGADEAVAIQIRSFRVFETPIDPVQVFDDFVPPQSFRYLSSDEIPEQIQSAIREMSAQR